MKAIPFAWPGRAPASAVARPWPPSLLRLLGVVLAGLLLALLFGAGNQARAQVGSVQTARYWFDSGTKTTMTAADGAFDEALETAVANAASSLSVGPHALNIEMQGADGQFGPVMTSGLNVLSPQSARVVRILSGEVQLGGNAPVAVAAADAAFDEAVELVVRNALSTGALTGPQALTIRLRGEDGEFGPDFTTVLNILSPLTARAVRIQSGEVQLGAGAPVAVVAADGAFDEAVELVVRNALSTGALSGPQPLIIRLRGEDGQFGPDFTSVLNIIVPFSARVVRIQSGEVQLGANPPVAVVAVDAAFDEAVEDVVRNALSVGALTGPQTIKIRLRGEDGQFGPDFTTVINILTPLVARPVRIQSGEVQLGAAAPVAVAAVDGAFDEAVEAVVKNALAVGSVVGPVTLKVRLRGEDGQFGPDFTTALNILAPMTARVVSIDEGRVWWDADLAGAVAMTIVNGNLNPAVATALGVRPTGSLTPGVHALRVQLRSEDGEWGNTFTRVVNVTPCTAPAMPVASATATVITVGQTISLSATVVPSATYEWRGPNGFTSTLRQPSITNAQVAASGTYWVRAIGAGPDFCPSPEDSVNVTVLPPVVIATGAVAPTAICAGSTFDVSYTVTSGTLNAGNQFRVQLSDANGSFTVPTLIGGPLMSTAASGSISVTIPGGTATGTQYRIRVVASSPAINGADNGAALSITTPFTVSATATPNPVAQGGAITLGVTGAPMGATVAWTGPNGFTSNQAAPTRSNMQPADVGAYQATVTRGACQSISSVTVTLTPTIATGTISPTTYCAGGAISVPFTVANGPMTSGNVFTAQLLDSVGTVLGTIGTLTGTTSGTISGTIPASAPYSLADRIRVVASNPATTGSVNGQNLTIIQLGGAVATSNSPVAAGGTITLGVSGVAAASLNTYAWTGPMGVTISGANTATASVTNAQVGASGTYQVVISRGGCSVTRTVSVTVNPSPSVITTGTISPTTYCAGGAISVPFTVGGGAFGAGNVFTAQLLDSVGTLLGTIGTLSGTAGGTISGTIPASAPYSLADRVRVVGSNPSTTGSVNAQNLTIIQLNGATATSNSPVATGGTIQLDVTGVAAASLNTYSWSKISGGGSFSSSLRNPTIAGATVANSGTYQVVVSRGGCSVTRTVNVTVNAAPGAVTGTGPIAPASYCAGAAISIPYAITGPFVSGNVFTAQLSNASGSFASPVTIGSVSGTAAGTISGIIPAATATGAGYRVRVISSNPASTGPDNGAHLTITAPFTVSAAATQFMAAGGTISLGVTGAPGGATYAWTGPGGFASAAAAPTRTGATLAMTGTYSVTVTNGTCTSTASTYVRVFDCSTANLAAGLPAGQYFVSSAAAGSGQMAFNGGGWNAGGFAPAFVGVDFGTSVTLNAITLTAGMSPSGNVNHVIETSTDLLTWTTAATISGFVSNGEVLYRSFAPVAARGLRVRSTASPSWIAWDDIRVSNCAPYITSFTPATGPSGTSVAITGGNFTGATGVAFNGTAAPGFVVNSATSISVNAPAAGSTGLITVTTPSGTATSATPYTYQVAVAVGTVTPTTYCAGAPISVPFTVTGGSYTSGNVFTARLVDSVGAVLGTIGTLTGTGSGTITGTIPTTAPYSLADRIRISTSNPAGTSAVTAQDLTVINLSGATATGNSPVSAGATISLNVTGAPAASLNTYAWTGPNGFTSSLRNPTLAGATVAMNGTYQVVVSRGGCSVTRSVTMTVDPGASTITTGTISPTTYCAGGAIAVPFTVGGGAFNAGNVFTAQLLDSVGTVLGTIGTLSGTTGGTINGTIPTTASYSLADRVRVVGSNPATVGSLNGQNLTIIQLGGAAAFSNSPITAGNPLTFDVTGVAATSLNTYAWTKISGGGSFSSSLRNPTIAGATTANSGTYQVVVSRGGCSVTRTVSVTVNPAAPTASITTTGPASGTYCAGSPIFVDFTTTGTFAGNNVFTAQLSDASGSFASPVTIGTVNGPGTGSGQIGGPIPVGTPAGTGYRVRVISSNPNLVGSTSGPLTVSATAFTWIGGVDSNWNNPANWSCGVVPGLNDDVTINPGGFAPVVGVGGGVVRSITINVNATLTVNSTFTVYGNVINTGTIGAGSGSGWVWAGTGAFTVGGTGTYNLWHVTVNNTLNLTINTTWTVRGNVVANGGISQGYQYFLFLPGTSAFSGGGSMQWGTYYVQTGGAVSWGTGLSAWSIYNGGAISPGTSTFTFWGGGGAPAGTVGGIGSGVIPFYNVVFNNPLGITQASDLSIANFWTNNYVFNPGTQQVRFTGSANIAGVNVVFYDLVIDVTANVTLDVDIIIRGNLTNDGLFNCGTRRVIFDGVNQVIDGSAVTNFYHVTFNNTVNLTLNQHIIVDGDWVNLGNFTGLGYYVLFSGTAAQTVGGSGSTRFGEVRWNNTSAGGASLGGPIRVAGNFGYLGGLWSAAGFPVTFDGTTTQTIGGPLVPVFAGLVNNNSSATGLALGVNVRGTGNWSGNGRFCGCGFEVWFNGTAQTISGPGRWDFHHVRITSSTSLTLNTNIYVYGDWYLDGVFVPGLFTVFFEGTANQLIGGPVVTNFYHLTINNLLSVTLNQTIRVRGNFGGTGILLGGGWFTIFDGSGAQTVSTGAGTRFGHLTFANAAGVSLGSNIGLVGNFLNTAGFVGTGRTVGFYGTGTQTVSGSGIVFGNAYTAPGATASLQVPVGFSGSLTNDGAWLANLHLCTFSGTGTIGGANAPLFYHLWIDGTVTLAVNLNLRGDIRINGSLVPVTYGCVFAGTAPQRIYGTAAVFNFYDIIVNLNAVVNVEVELHIKHDCLNNGTINWPVCRVVYFDGMTLQTIGGTTVTRFCGINVNNPTGTVTLAQNIRCSGDFRDLGGWRAGGFTTTFDGNGAQGIYGLAGGGTRFGGLTFNNGSAGGATLFGPIGLTGDFRNTAGFRAGGFGMTFQGTTGTQNIYGPSQIVFHHVIIDVAAVVQLNLDIRLTGNWTNRNVFLPNSWRVWFVGTVAQFIYGPAVTNFFHLTINNPVSVRQDVNIRVRGNFIDNGVYCGCGYLTTFDGSAPQTITCSSGNTRFHDIRFVNPTGVTLLNAIGVTGNWINDGGFAAGGQLVLFAGTGAQTIGGSALTTFHDWRNTNNSTAGVSLIRDAAWTGSWTNDGRYCGCGFGSSFVGTTPQTITCNTLQSAFHHITLSNTSTGGVRLGGHIGVTGNWHVTGLFFPATWTVYFQGTAGQTITRGGSMLHCQFYGISIGNTSTAGVRLGTNCPLYFSGPFTGSGTFGANGNGIWANGGTGGNGSGGNGAGGHLGGSATAVGGGGGGTGAQTCTATVPTTFGDWTIQNPAGVTCAGPGYLGIQQVLTLAPGSGNLACGNAVTLLSNPTGTGMIVNTPTGGICTGLGTTERYIDAPLSGGTRPPGYRHYSSPMRANTSTVNEFADDLPVFNINPAFNTAANPNAVRPFPTLYVYDDQHIPTATPIFDRGWMVPASTTTALIPGKGYSAQTDPDTKVDITGTFQNGPVTTPTLTRGAFSVSGWNLVGNPYPAPIDWRLVSKPAAVNNALYIHQPTGRYTGQYASWVNGQSVNSAQPELASMQGFFVRVNTPGTATLTFTNAARLTTWTSPAFRRAAPGQPVATAETRPTIRLVVTAPATGKDDEAVVYFEQGATRAFDGAFDAGKPVLSGDGYPTLWSSNGTESFAINGLPVADLTNGHVIPLAVRVPADGQYRLTARQLLNLPAGAPVWLEDRQMGTVTNLAVDSAYVFRMVAANTTPRFYLNLGAGTPTSLTPALDFATARLDVFPNPAQTDVRVRLDGLPTGLGAVQAELVDALGRTLLRATLRPELGTAQADLDVHELPQGVYTLRLRPTGAPAATGWARKVVIGR